VLHHLPVEENTALLQVFSFFHTPVHRCGRSGVCCVPRQRRSV